MRLAALTALLGLAACATPIDGPLLNANDPLKGFQYCASAGCSHKWPAMKFTESEWRELSTYFEGTTDAADERVRIAKAISRYETIIGKRGGTSGDVGGTGLNPIPEFGQLDCFAEAINTGVALRMMHQAGWLKFHTPEPTTMRGLGHGTFGMVHATATMKETANGRLWVVDTWFFDNGGPTFVIDREEWRAHWTPEGGAGI